MAQFADKLGRERYGSTGCIDELFKKKRDTLEKEEGADGKGSEDFLKKSRKIVRMLPGGEEVDMKGMLRELEEELREGLRGVREELREWTKGGNG